MTPEAYNICDLIREGNSLRLKLQIFEGTTTLCAVDDLSTCNYSTEVQKQFSTNNESDHSPKRTSHLQTHTEERGNDNNTNTTTVADLENQCGICGWRTTLSEVCGM